MKASANTNDRFVIIMAGGRGERFWPVSREKTQRLHVICLRRECDLQLKQRGLPVLVAATGGESRCLARIVTPFILERANPSKDGDAKPWAFGHRANGCQVAEGMGR